jgi:hypothetical protein
VIFPGVVSRVEDCAAGLLHEYVTVVDVVVVPDGVTVG